MLGYFVRPEIIKNERNRFARSNAVRGLRVKYRFNSIPVLSIQTINFFQAWNEKFMNIEQALSLLDMHCTDYIKTEVDKSTQVIIFLSFYNLFIYF